MNDFPQGVHPMGLNGPWDYCFYHLRLLNNSISTILATQYIWFLCKVIQIQRFGLISLPIQIWKNLYDFCRKLLPMDKIMRPLNEDSNNLNKIRLSNLNNFKNCNPTYWSHKNDQYFWYTMKVKWRYNCKDVWRNHVEYLNVLSKE